MTGFYLCLVHLMISCATLYLRAEFLLKDLAVYSSNARDVAILTRHHFGNLDSMNSKGSSSVSYPIRTIISEPRPHSISSLKGNKRACSLEEVVQTFYQIPTIITDRKPSSNLLGRYYSNEGPSSVLRFEDSYGCRSKDGKVAPHNLIPLKRVQIKTNHQRKQAQLPNIYLHNMRSLNLEKLNELKLIAHQCDLIMLTESWLKNGKEGLYNIDGYDLHTCNRSGRRIGGGVAVYVRSNLSVQKLAEYKTTHASAYWFVYKQSDFTPIIYSVIYHPPGLTKDYKNNTTEHIISTASKLLQSYPNAKLVITGDFNDLDTTQISAKLPLREIVNFSTRGDAKLDLIRSEEHTSELQSLTNLVCRLLLEKKKTQK